MDVTDALLVERGGKLALGEARPARGRDRTGVDQEIDLGALQFAQDRSWLRLLITDRKYMRASHS
jgi:hypothetical protein